jgi:hypothetical protein
MAWKKLNIYSLHFAKKGLPFKQTLFHSCDRSKKFKVHIGKKRVNYYCSMDTICKIDYLLKN